MSEQTPRDFNELKDATIKYQEEKYLDELLGDATVRNDEKSRQREEEVREYDAHLQSMDKKREEYFDNSNEESKSLGEVDPSRDLYAEYDHRINEIFQRLHQKHQENGKEAEKLQKYAGKLDKTYENMTPYELTYKIAEAKFYGDKTTEGNLYSVLLDKIAEQENEQAKQAESTEDSPEQSEADAAREAILNPDNVAALRAELAEDESDDSEVTPLVPVDPIPPTDPSEIVNGNEAPGADLVLSEPMPADPAERESWFRRNRRRLLGAVAGLALFASGFALGTLTDIDGDRNDSGDKTEQPSKKGGGAPKDDVMKKVKFSQNFSDKNHAGNKVNAFGGTERGIVEKADFGTLSGDYLERYFDTHDRITAHNVEKLVNVRFQEKYGLDATKFNSSWGQQERESMKKEYLSDSGHSLSEAGQKAHKLHMNELRSGKTLKVTAAEAASKYGLDVNSWISEGKLEGGIDDKAYAAGNTHDAIYITFDDKGNIKHAEIGNCGNEVFSIEGSSSIPLNTPESTPDTDQPNDDTDEAIGEIDGDTDWPTGEKNPDEPKKHTPKGTVDADQEGTSTTGGVGATGPGAENPHQDAGAQTQDQANEQTGGGSQGSTNPAEDANQGPSPSNPNEGASGQTGSGTVNE